MTISFPKLSAYDFDHFAVAFPADVDGVRRRILVSVEALQDHFGADEQDTFVPTFESNRPRIEALAKRMIELGVAGDIILSTNMF